MAYSTTQSIVFPLTDTPPAHKHPLLMYPLPTLSHPHQPNLAIAPPLPRTQNICIPICGYRLFTVPQFVDVSRYSTACSMESGADRRTAARKAP